MASFGAPAASLSSGTPLDGPPPSPTPMSSQPVGGSFGMKGMAPQGPQPISSGQMPPEVLTGITQAAQTISTQLDSFAQVTPDKATQLAMIKELLQQYLADLMSSGAGPTSATAPGAAFPGGGIDRGMAGPGAV